MIKKLLIIIILLAAYFGSAQENLALFKGNADSPDNSALVQAISQRRSDVQVQGSGEVVKILADDLVGSRHQRFIVKIENDKTILIAHNIDLADKIEVLKRGDQVKFYGEYEWNQKGGVVHWTHHDPQGRHAGGWLKHKGVKYQ